MAQLTQGRIRPQLIALSAPMLMGNILQQLYNMVDAVIVGRFVGETAFASVGVSGAVMNLFLFLISGECDGVCALFNFLGSGLAGWFRGRGQAGITVIGAVGHISARVVLSLLLAPSMGLPAAALATGIGWMGVVGFWSCGAARNMKVNGGQNVTDNR